MKEDLAEKLKTCSINFMHWNNWVQTDQGKKYSKDLDSLKRDLYDSAVQSNRDLLKNANSSESFLERIPLRVSRQEQHPYMGYLSEVFPFLSISPDMGVSVMTLLELKSSPFGIKRLYFHSTAGLPLLVGKSITAEIFLGSPSQLYYLGEPRSHVGGNLTRQSGQTIFEGIIVPQVYKRREPVENERVLALQIDGFYASAVPRDLILENGSSYKKEVFIQRGDPNCFTQDSLKQSIEKDAREKVRPESYGFERK
jgi:hypothetical protein